MDKFKIPKGTSSERAIEMLVNEINSLKEKLHTLENPFSSITYIEESRCAPYCNADYTGERHRIDCPKFLQKI